MTTRRILWGLSQSMERLWGWWKRRRVSWEGRWRACKNNLTRLKTYWLRLPLELRSKPSTDKNYRAKYRSLSTSNSMDSRHNNKSWKNSKCSSSPLAHCSLLTHRNRNLAPSYRTTNKAQSNPLPNSRL